MEAASIDVPPPRTHPSRISSDYVPCSWIKPTEIMITILFKPHFSCPESIVYSLVYSNFHAHLRWVHWRWWCRWGRGSFGRAQGLWRWSRASGDWNGRRWPHNWSKGLTPMWLNSLLTYFNFCNFISFMSQLDFFIHKRTHLKKLLVLLQWPLLLFQWKSQAGIAIPLMIPSFFFRILINDHAL